MLAIVLAVSLSVAPACVGDGHNHHRSKSAVKRFQKAWGSRPRIDGCLGTLEPLLGPRYRSSNASTAVNVPVVAAGHKVAW